MSSQHDNSASTGGNKSNPSPTPSSRANLMLTLTRSLPSEKNENGEQLHPTTEESLIADQVALIFGFLKHNEIMYARVCTTWRDAAKKVVPYSYFGVWDVRSYNAMRVFASALPNTQQLTIYDLGDECKYADGEDPDEGEGLASRTAYYATTANYTTHDLNIISSFRKLRILNVLNQTSVRDKMLNGRYPALFDFPLLQKLKILDCSYLKWDLNMLSGCPLLITLELIDLRQQNPTGNLSSLRVLKNTLEEVAFQNCHSIQGNFMELADFPRLKYLYINETPVIGDIRHIQEDDFSAAEGVVLPDTVIGGRGYQFQRISDVPRFMQAIHPLMKRSSKSFQVELPRWCLSKDSADFYEERTGFPPPFQVRPVLAGSRLGWRWYSDTNWQTSACEVNWLDPEPSQDSDDYDKYVKCLQRIENKPNLYRGYHKPPTEEEYRRLCLRLRGRGV